MSRYLGRVVKATGDGLGAETKNLCPDVSREDDYVFGLLHTLRVVVLHYDVERQRFAAVIIDLVAHCAAQQDIHSRCNHGECVEGKR